MLEIAAVVDEPGHAFVDPILAPSPAGARGLACLAPGGALAAMVAGLPLRRRSLRARQYLFRAGQPRRAVYLIHAGFFKTCVASADGREKITGFRLRGDLLGIDALDMPVHACDAVALDLCEVRELPCDQLQEALPRFQECLASAMAAEIRRDWRWMLVLGTLTAEKRVVSFLLDFAARLQVLGFSASNLVLRMTRAEMGNFLSLQLETVTRALSRLQARGMLEVDGRRIRILDADGLRELVGAEA